MLYKCYRNQLNDFYCQGERLSHALGCAFAACLADKQKANDKVKKVDVSSLNNVIHVFKYHMRIKCYSYIGNSGSNEWKNNEIVLPSKKACETLGYQMVISVATNQQWNTQ